MTTLKPEAPRINAVSARHFLASYLLIAAIAWAAAAALGFAVLAYRHSWSSAMVEYVAVNSLFGPFAYVYTMLHMIVHEAGHVVAGAVVRPAVFPRTLILGKHRHLELPFRIHGAPVFLGCWYGGYADYDDAIYTTPGPRRLIIALGGPCAAALMAGSCLLLANFVGPDSAHTLRVCGTVSLLGELYNLSGLSPHTDGRFLWNAVRSGATA